MQKYTASEQDKKFIEETFTYHKPFGDQPERYEELRAGGRFLAETIVANCPVGRERSLALTQLQQAIMFANAAIAITEKEGDQAGPTAGAATQGARTSEATPA